MRAATLPLWIVAAASLCGCAVGPDYQKPEADVPAAWAPDAPWEEGRPNDVAVKGPWWTLFGDAQLNAVEQQALEHNQTLVIASAHLDQARQLVTVAASGLYPQLGLSAQAFRTRTSANRPEAAYGLPNSSTVENDYLPTFTVQYEVDLFGRARRQLESARASAQQSQADLESARLVLNAEVAADYFNLRELDLEIDVVRRSIEGQRRALEFVTARHDDGAASGLDVAQEQAQLDATATQIDLLREQRAQLEHALATLAGAPAPRFSLAPSTAPLAAPHIPIALPSEVLQRRPDVASAERAMAAANAQIGVAKAAYFPSLALSGAYGADSSAISNLLSAPSIAWSIGASATQTLFDAGATRANVAFARAGYSATVANYRQTVLTAMQEVEDGITGLATLSQASAQAEAAVVSANRVLALATDRYSGGLDTYLDVVTAQQAMLTNQRQATQILGQQLVTSVFLVKALGGGWPDASQGTESVSTE